MKIELRNLKVAKFLSEETIAFRATVYVDEIRAFEAENDGHGGSNILCPIGLQGRDLLAKAEEWVKTLPPEKSEFGDIDLPMDLDFYINTLVEQEMKIKEYRAKCKKYLVFRDAEDKKKGTYRRLTSPYSAEAATYVRDRYGNDVEILNETLGFV